MNIEKQIKKLRKAQVMTQKQLAEKMELAEITIRQYESGKRDLTIKQLNKIASALDVTLSDIIGPNSSILGQKEDYEYNVIRNTFNDIGFSIDSNSKADNYYITPKSESSNHKEQVEISHSVLAETLQNVLFEADSKRNNYIRKRFEAELFGWES